MLAANPVRTVRSCTRWDHDSRAPLSDDRDLRACACVIIHTYTTYVCNADTNRPYILVLTHACAREREHARAHTGCVGGGLTRAVAMTYILRVWVSETDG